MCCDLGNMNDFNCTDNLFLCVSGHCQYSICSVILNFPLNHILGCRYKCDVIWPNYLFTSSRPLEDTFYILVFLGYSPRINMVIIIVVTHCSRTEIEWFRLYFVFIYMQSSGWLTILYITLLTVWTHMAIMFLFIKTLSRNISWWTGPDSFTVSFFFLKVILLCLTYFNPLAQLHN